PIQVAGLSGVTQIAGGDDFVCALLSNGTVECWGSNLYGQLGNASVTGSCQGQFNVCSSSPVQVSGVSGATAIAAGASHSLAIKAGATVWAWGLNSSGQLGNNSTTTAKTPVQVSGLSGAIAIAGGASHSLALKSDGTVWAWGLNSSGQLGNNSTTTSKIPVQVKNLTGVIAIAAGANDSLALKSDGTVWAWGLNSSGQLGNGTTTTSKIPVQVKNLTGIAAIGSGASHSLYAPTTGAPSAVGLNSSGQLGNGTTTTASTAVSVSNLQDVRATSLATYTYDGDGLRASATSQGATQHYAWDTTATNPLLLADGSTSYIYGPDDLPLEQITSAGTVSYYHHDQLGSTRLLTSSTGAVTATYSYGPYGQLTNQAGSTDTPLRWAGQYQDASTGLYYLRARDYDPRTGQFLTRDPLDQFTRAAYGYANDDPLNAHDPSGLGFWSIVHSIAGWVSTGTGACGATMFWNPVGDVCLAASTISGGAATLSATVLATQHQGSWLAVGLSAAGTAVGAAGGGLISRGGALIEDGQAALQSGSIGQTLVGSAQVAGGVLGQVGGAGLNAAGVALPFLPSTPNPCLMNQL
ncbi:MAG: RHS repeat-associated core domain-containing protein, partial [Solirubrobacteraceae bacterium]